MCASCPAAANFSCDAMRRSRTPCTDRTSSACSGCFASAYDSSGVLGAENLSPRIPKSASGPGLSRRRENALDIADSPGSDEIGGRTDQPERPRHGAEVPLQFTRGMPPGRRAHTQTAREFLGDGEGGSNRTSASSFAMRYGRQNDTVSQRLQVDVEHISHPVNSVTSSRTVFRYPVTMARISNSCSSRPVSEDRLRDSSSRSRPRRPSVSWDYELQKGALDLLVDAHDQRVPLLAAAPSTSPSASAPRVGQRQHHQLAGSSSRIAILHAEVSPREGRQEGRRRRRPGHREDERLRGGSDGAVEHLRAADDRRWS